VGREGNHSLVDAVVSTPTPLDKKALLDAAFDAMGETIANLAGRWDDEQEYEGFPDYEKVLKAVLKELAPSLIFMSATKRPFGFFLAVPDFDATYWMGFEGDSYLWKRTS
jgi:hypothetical protein